MCFHKRTLILSDLDLAKVIDYGLNFEGPVPDIMFVVIVLSTFSKADD